MSEARSPRPEARLDGWLFDVYPSHDGMVVWIIDTEGRPHRARYRYAPTLYIAGDRGALEAAREALAGARMPVTLEPATRRELMSGEEIPVTAVAVSNPLAFPTVPRLLSRGLTELLPRDKAPHRGVLLPHWAAVLSITSEDTSLPTPLSR